MIPGTLARYIAWRFFSSAVIIFTALVLLVAMVDFVEMLRRSADMKGVSTLLVAEISFYRVPFLAERVLPFAVLVAGISCYLNLSRRLELVVARSAGVSAWQFVWPSVVTALLVGVAATTLYNPISAALREQSARLEGELFRGNRSYHEVGTGFWVRQRSDEGQAIINAVTSSRQGIELSGVSVFKLDQTDHFQERIEAKSAVLHRGFWRLEEARIYTGGEDTPPVDQAVYDLKTSMTESQVRESFATPETVPFWQLTNYIQLAESSNLAAAGYQLQYIRLLAQPFYLATMVLLAASVSLRSFRFGGVQKMVLGGVLVGFLLFVISKVVGDLSKAGLMPPLAAAALPPVIGGLTGIMTMLYQEDG